MEHQKILFVDDDPEIREVLRLLLESEGYQVVEAASGEQGLEKLDDSVGLVILDVMMPGMNGYGVCAEIRRRSAVPVLFLTAKSQDSDKTLGFSAGGDDYLVKPFSYSELISRVKAMLRRYYVYGAKQTEGDTVIHCCGNVEIDPRQCTVRQEGREVSLTETLEPGDDGSSLSLMDVIAVDDDMLEELDARDACRKVRQCVRDCLTPRERDIIVMRYGLGERPPKTQREVAAQCGISRSYVSRIEKRALAKLEQAMEDWRPEGRRS